MAKITDPDQLNIGTEMSLNTGTREISLNVAGNLVAKDGVTLQALYSKLEELWTSDTYNNHPFPMYAIDYLSGQFYFGYDGVSYNGWKLANDTMRTYIRDSGWREYLSDGTLDREYVGIVSLGTLDSAGIQCYYQRVDGGATYDFTYTDEPNEGILVYEDGGIDERTYFKAFARVYGYSYDGSDMTETGFSSTGPFKLNVLLENQVDAKIQVTDAALLAATPYVGTSESNATDGSVTSGSDLFNSASSSFAVGDVGKVITIATGSNAGIYYIIARNSATQVQVNRNFAATQSSITFHKRTDGGITRQWIDGNGFTAASVGSLVVDDVRQDTAGRWFICTGNGTIDAAGVADYTNNGGTATLAAYSGERAINGVYYAFNIIFDGKNATAEQIYTKARYELRQDHDIDTGTGTHIGKRVGWELLFVGDDLVTNQGVYIDNYNVNDANRITFTDVLGVEHANPFVAAGTLTFGPLLASGGTGEYSMYFTDLAGSADYGLTGAVAVNDADGNPISGTISSSEIAFTFDYDGNNQGGRTPATDAAVTVVASNAGIAKPVITTYTITRNTGQAIALASEEDFGYSASTGEFSFDGATKVISHLTTISGGVAVLDLKKMWAEWVDWLQTSTNSKFYLAFDQLGGDDIDPIAGTTIPVYFFLINGWTITPQNANHTVSVTNGILLVDGGGDPFNDVSGKTIRINYQQPVQAITVETGGAATESLYVNTSNGDVLKPL